MNRTRFFFGEKSLLVITASVLALTATLSEVGWSQAEESDKREIVRRVAQEWIQVGMEQYRRGLFNASEQSLLGAWEYQEYLTAAEREKLDKLLEKTRMATIERKRILEHIRMADELVERDELIKAKAHLEKVRGSEFLTKEERKLIAEELKKLNSELGERKKAGAELYNRSVGFYRAGQLEKAREGFIRVASEGLLTAPAGKTAEDYLVKIDNILIRRVEPWSFIETRPLEKVPEPAVRAIEDELPGVGAEAAQEAEPEMPLIKSGANKPAMIAVAEPDESRPVDVTTNRRRNVLRSYTKAVVNDAVAKAENYLGLGEFDMAKEAVEKAKRTVNHNRQHLGDELFRQYSGELRRLAEKIAKERARWLGSWESKGAWSL